MIEYLKKEVTTFVGNGIVSIIAPVTQALAYVSTFILKKSTKSLKAICELCESGYYEDAQIIARSIFEDSLTLAYICSADSDRRGGISIITSDEFAQLYILHGTEEQKKKRDHWKGLEEKGKCKDWIEGIKSNSNYEDFQKRYDGLRSHYRYPDLREQAKRYLVMKNRKDCRNEKTWNLLSIRGSAELVGDPYECDYHFLYWSISQLAHSSALGSFGYYRESKTVAVEMLPPLILGFAYYLRIAKNVNGVFKLGLDDKLNQIEANFVKLYNETPESAELER